jgi:hypothetical protein
MILQPIAQRVSHIVARCKPLVDESWSWYWHMNMLVDKYTSALGEVMTNLNIESELIQNGLQDSDYFPKNS